MKVSEEYNESVGGIKWRVPECMGVSEEYDESIDDKEFYGFIPNKVLSTTRVLGSMRV